MHRRNFLKIFSFMLMGSAHGACGKQLQGYTATPSPKRIIVIGAGLAGLAAGQELHKHGQDVVVIEARERIGGRIWTSTQWPDLPLDFGATWIHGPQGNPLTELAAQVDAQRLTTRYDRAVTYNTAGQPLSEAEAERLEDWRKQVFRALRAAQEAETDASIRQVIEPLIRPFDKSSEAYRFINFILSGEIEQEYAGSAERLSAHWYDSALAFAGDDELFVQGFQVIPEFLAQGLQIELGQVVTEVQWSPSAVRVITQKAEFSADRVIVTLPLGVLQAQSVRFTPELPPNKQEAIAQLGMGVLNKCYLRFPETFWPPEVDWLEHVSANPGEWTEWVSFKRAADMPILLGFNAADRGREIEAWTDRQIVASAMQTLRTLYGADIPEPLDYQLTRWASDPFALGSYSYNAVGAVPEMRQDLAAPVENALFFAGEASHQDHFGTAHGAYLSGIRVAQEVLMS